MGARCNIDIELHDSLDEEITEPLSILDLSNSQRDPADEENFDTDDDSFGEASDDCMPDERYMEQLLEDYHPERINLLDSTVPESIYNRQARTSSSEFSKADPETKTETAMQTNKRIKAGQAKGNTGNDSEVDGSDAYSDGEEGDECLDEGQGIMEARTQLQRSKTLKSMGKTLKNSSRIMKSGLLSEPFKELTKTT